MPWSAAHRSVASTDQCVPLPALPENFKVRLTTRNYWGADEDVNAASRKVELVVRDTAVARLLQPCLDCPCGWPGAQHSSFLCLVSVFFR